MALLPSTEVETERTRTALAHVSALTRWELQQDGLCFNGWCGKQCAKELRMNGISSIAHVALKVRDLERSLDFYTGKLGFREMMRLDKPDGSPGVWLVYLRITDTQYLEIFPEGQGERAPGWDDTAINHVCLGVDNLDGILAHIEAMGIPLLLPKKQAVDGNWQAWIEDPDGNRIEFMQTMPDSLQLQAIERLRLDNAE